MLKQHLIEHALALTVWAIVMILLILMAAFTPTAPGDVSHWKIVEYVGGISFFLAFFHD